MAYSEPLAGRVRKRLGRRAGLAEKTMFGGLGFLIGGNLAVAVRGDELLVRVEPAQTQTLLRERGARRFDTGRQPMKGWLVVGAAGINDDASLATWVERGAQYAASLPKKAARK
jgi:TfoX/Sxy family transcriptional regulator of competence genes